MTLCTVAIPVYNRRTLVLRALESALSQDVHGLEILVVDNCSTDGTWDVLNEYADPRLRLVRNERNLGLFGNFNRCLELAAGQYLQFLCSDDRLVAGAVRRGVDLLERHPDVALLSTRAAQVDAAYRRVDTFADLLTPGVYPGDEMIAGALWMLTHYNENPFNYPSGVMMRREAAVKAGGFADGFRQIGDVDLWLRILEHGGLAVVDGIGCEVLLHGGQAGGPAYFNEGTVYEEWFTLVQRWEAHLRRHGIYEQVRGQVAACALWAAVYCVRKGRANAARRYWRTATGGRVPWPALGRAFGVHLRLKVENRLRNGWHQPLRPCRPLDARPQGEPA